MATIELVDVTKSFSDRVTALDHVSLNIPDGSFFTLLGPSGCGKTTTLRIIAGLEHPSSGEVRIRNRDVTNLTPKERGIAMVFQNYALYPHMTVADNIGYPLRIRKRSREEIAKRVSAVAESLDIESLLGRKPGEISGGQQQRVALARAIVQEPGAFLFDEPLSNLDAKLRENARAFLKKLQLDLGITTVYVTHDQTEAMAMSDCIAVMEAGRLRQVGPPLEVYRRPANLFVAGFIGSPPMNLVDVRNDVSAGCLVAGGIQIPFRGEAPAGPLILGVRPEDLIILRESQPETIPGRVFLVEPLGSETLVHVTAGGVTLKVKTFGDTELKRGEPVWLKAREDRFVLFDPSSGQALPPSPVHAGNPRHR